MFDGKAFGQEIVAAVKAHMEKALGPVMARLDAVEQKLVASPKPKDGEPGKSVTIDDVTPMIRGEIERVAGEVARSVPVLVEAAVAALPKARDGEDASAEMVRDAVALELDARGASVEAIQAVITAADEAIAEMQAGIPDIVADAVAAIPPGEPGKSVDPAEIKHMVDEAVAALPSARPGKDADPVQITEEIRAEVAKAVAALPAAKDGHTPTSEELAPLVAEAVSNAVSVLPVAKDGVGLADAIIDREGRLVLTMTDGRAKELGVIVGKDGDDVDMTVVEHRVKALFDAWPKPRDGVGFDDMDLVETDAGVFVRFTRGDVVKEFRLPVVIDRGVFRDDGSYRKGDGVTWGGSFWIAQTDGPDGKPDGGGKGWRLAVKKGRDGKPGPVKV